MTGLRTYLIVIACLLTSCRQPFEHRTDASHRFMSHYNQGLGYFQDGDLYDAAMSFSKALELVPKIADPHLAAMLYESFAKLYSASGDYDGSLKYSLMRYDSCMESGETAEVIPALVEVAKAYAATGNLDKAEYLSDRLLNNDSLPDSLRTELDECLISAHDRQHSPNVNTYSIYKAQNDYYRSRSEYESLKARSIRQQLIIVILVASIIIILSRRRMVAFHREIEQVSHQLAQTEAHFSEERQQLRHDYIQMYRRQFDYFATISKAVLTADQNSRGKAASVKYKEVHDQARAMVQDIFSDSDGQKRFEADIDRRMGGAMSMFRADFPNLKEEDYRFVSFLFVHFSADMISMIFKFLSTHAVYTRKYRIRQMIINSNSTNKDFYLDLIN